MSRMRVVPALAKLLVSLLAGAPSAIAQPRASSAAAEFPIDHWGEPITLPVTWNGKRAYFLVDTGCTNDCIDPAEFPDLKRIDIDAKLMTAGGKQKAVLFAPPDVRIGPISLKDDGPVIAMDLSDLSAMLGRPVIGIVGTAGLKKCAVQIDYDSRTVRLFAPGDEQPADSGPSVPMRLDMLGCPAVELSLAGTKHSVEIDTGQNSPLSLPTELFQRLDKQSGQPAATAPALTFKGSLQLHAMRIDGFDLLGAHYQGLICTETHGIAALGLEFLERHRATLDFPQHKLFLLPGREFDRASEMDMSGIHARRIGEQLVAQFVDAGSPADSAGLRPGDIITAINGKPAADYSMPQFWDATTAGDGREITIAFSRGDHQQTVTFKLRRAI